jgi:hypothetical protein
VTGAASATSAQAARGRSPTQAPGDTVIDGPSADIVGLDGMSIARDGTGGVVYVKDVLGIPHVFVSRLTGGVFGPPVQVDAGLAGTSSQPVLAAGQGGLLLVAFINGGGLWEATSTGSAVPLSTPAALWATAANPAISLSNFGKGYLAFTDTSGAGGGDVRSAFYYQGQWALASGPLDANPPDQAGVGAGRPSVVASGDGVGIVAWGEAGHIFTRRVIRTAPSVVAEQADVPTLSGSSEVSSGNPVISTGGDSTYAAVAFSEQVRNGAAQQARVLVNRLHGSQYDGIRQADGATTGGAEGADQPQAAVTEYGSGFVTSETDQTHELFASTLSSNDSFGSTLRVDSLPNSDPPDAVPATAGLVSNVIAWQQTPGIAGSAEIRVRYAADGADLGPEQVVSSPSLGATNADLGLVAAGDVSGDAAVAWVQGSGSNAQIVAVQLYQAPGGFVPAHAFSYSVSAQPPLNWSGAAELWGSPQYAVRLDGVLVGQTPALGMFVPTPIANGRHTYQVTAVNQAGLTSVDNPATVFVDTVAPKVAVKLSGSRIVKTAQQIRVSYSDPPPPGQSKAVASGVAMVTVKWGDGSAQARIRRTTAAHTYRRPRAYTVTVTVTDRAGNATVVTRKLQIKPKPKPKPKKKKKKGRTR